MALDDTYVGHCGICGHAIYWNELFVPLPGGCAVHWDCVEDKTDE